MRYLCVFTESFVEVSEEETIEEDEEDSLVVVGEKDEVQENGTEKDGKPERSPAAAPGVPAAALQSEEDEDEEGATEEELKDGTETESQSAPVISEWEHFDTVMTVLFNCFNCFSTQ